MARKTGLKGLQEWAKHVTQGYRDVEITNMTTSFKSGLAFCAIIHRYRPELIPYDELKKENVFDNNKLAFSVAESELDIPALLDAEDMVALTVPDKLSVATYLSQYYNYFKDKEPAGKMSGVKVQAKTQPAPSPKRTKLDSAKSVSSPLLPLSSKENIPVSSPPTRPSPPVSTSQNQSSIQRGRKSKFSKPEATPTDESQGTLKRGTMGSEQCEVCGERVFLMERLGVENRVFHRACFKCCVCRVALKPVSYEHDAKSGKFYCQQHYREAVRQQTIKRTMAERGLSPAELDSMTPPLKPKRSKKYKNKSGGSTPVTSSSSNQSENKSAVVKSSSAQVPEPTVTVASSGHSPPAVVANEKRELSHSGEVKVGLPSLLKSLASSKQQRENAPPVATVINKPQQKDGTQSVILASSTQQKEVRATTTLPGTSEAAKPVRISPQEPSKPHSSIPNKPPPPTSSIPAKPPPPSTGKSPVKPTEPVTSGASVPVKTVEYFKRKDTSKYVTSTSVKPVVSTSTPVKPVVSTSTPVKPVVSTSTPVKPVVSTSTPVKPVVSTSTPVKPVVSTSTPVKPVVSTSSPVKPVVSTSTPVKPVVSTSTPVKPVVSTSTPVKPVVSTSTPVKPVVSTSTPVKPVVSESTPVKPVVSESTPVKPVVSTSTPVKPVVSTSTPVKPPRHKKTTTPSSEPSPEIPSKRGSVKPKRPAPPRPSHPPSIKRGSGQHYNNNRGGETVDLQVLTERRKRRVGVLKRRLEDVEREQERMEQRGVQLEQQLRQNGDEAEDHLIEEWFALVNDRNMLLRQESDLVYELKDLQLIEQHEALDTEIRRRLNKDESLKTEVERLEEEAMIGELVELVEKRDKLLWTLHLEKTQDEEEDRQVELIASTQVHPAVQRNKSLSFM